MSWFTIRPQVPIQERPVNETAWYSSLGVRGRRMLLGASAVSRVQIFSPCYRPGGGPVYAIPGTVTEKTLIAFTASGEACVKSNPTICTNAAV